MRLTRLIVLIPVIILICLTGVGRAQVDDEVASSSSMVEFSIYKSSLDLAFDTFSQERAPDSLKIESLKVASGFLKGVYFHYERNRDKLSILEQVEDVADDIQYMGYTQTTSGTYIFNYTLWVPTSVMTSGRSGQSVQGHGISDLEDMADAREDAREQAFESAVMEALRREYTDRDRVIPGVVDGRITWYEVNRDETDPENGLYVFDIDAWIKFETDQ